MEAESYAHQCFKEHRMTMPRRQTEWGRAYVGSWVERDRAAGIRIDPRAEAYAKGLRSPYVPLRFVPSTWKIFAGEPPIQLLVDGRVRRRAPDYRPPRTPQSCFLLSFGGDMQALTRCVLL